MKRTFSAVAVTSSLLATTALASPLPPLNPDLSTVTVSGLSSGGYMANQFHVAFSDWVSGVGVIAAGPYYCGQNDITTALSQCVDKMAEPLELDALNKQAKTWEKAGKIAQLENLKGDKVWILHGTADNRVNSKVTDLLAKQYESWAGAENVTYVHDKAFAHVFPTLASGGSCTSSESPYIGNCDYDAAGIMLQAISGTELKQPDDTLTGEVYTFNQHTLGGENATTMGETGYAYVPGSCREGESCQVHISFHGCNQFADAVGTAYVEQTGLNRWADDNNMIVVYPQTRKSLFMPLNPQGCWDWWGYTGADYATAEGKQMVAVKAMVEALAKGAEK